MPSSTDRPPALLTGWVALTVLLFALIAHAGAGVADAGRIVWHPGGHGSLLVLFLWGLAVMLGFFGLEQSRGRSVPAWVAVAGGLAGIGLGFTGP